MLILAASTRKQKPNAPVDRIKVELQTMLTTHIPAMQMND